MKLNQYLDQCDANERYFQSQIIADELKREEAINDAVSILYKMIEEVYFKRDFISQTTDLKTFTAGIIRDIAECL